MEAFLELNFLGNNLGSQRIKPIKTSTNRLTTYYGKKDEESTKSSDILSLVPTQITKMKKLRSNLSSKKVGGGGKNWKNDSTNTWNLGYMNGYVKVSLRRK